MLESIQRGLQFCRIERREVSKPVGNAKAVVFAYAISMVGQKGRPLYLGRIEEIQYRLQFIRGVVKARDAR